MRRALPPGGLLAPASGAHVVLLPLPGAAGAALTDALHAAGWAVRHVDTLAEAASACAGADAVVLDWDAAGGAEAITPLLQRLVATAPVVVLADRRDTQAYVTAARGGAMYCLDRSQAAERLPDMLVGLASDRAEGALRVLLVEDDPLQAQLYEALLHRTGFTVRVCTDPSVVFALAEAFQPHAVVQDLNLPGVDGVELAAALRLWRGDDGLAVVVLSAEADPQRQLDALRAGADDFLPKPVDAVQLAAVVRERARRARRAQTQIQQLQTLRREQAHILQTLDQHAIVSITDTAGRILYASGRFCTISGYRRDELLGQNHRLLKSGDHPPEFYAELWRTIADGRIWHGEICNRRKDGSRYWVLSTIAPMPGPLGRPYRYVSIHTDIAALKQAQADLERHKERLRRGQIYANIGTWDWNIQTGELYWSERIAPLFGYPAGDLKTTYENFLNAVHPDDRQKVIDAVNACVERDVPYEIEHRVVWPDGRVHWLLARGAVQRDATGRPVHMLGVVQDIQARKMAELGLAERTQQLEEAQALAHLGHWSADFVSGELLWSDEIYRIFGYAPGAVTPSVELFRSAVHPDDRSLVLAREQEAVSSGHYDVVHRIVRPSGEVRWVHEMGRPILNERGQLIRLTGIVQDITERVEAE